MEGSKTTFGRKKICVPLKQCILNFFEICWRRFPAYFFVAILSFLFFCINCDCCGKNIVSNKKEEEEKTGTRDLLLHSNTTTAQSRSSHHHKQARKRSYFGTKPSLSPFLLLINSTTPVVVVLPKKASISIAHSLLRIGQCPFS